MTAGVGGGGPGGPAGAPGPAAPTSYLEQDRNTVMNTEQGIKKGQEWAEVRCVGCRSWFCPHCCVSKGIGLKDRLRRELATFSGLMMLTFTVDPQLFDGPRAAY